jgi:hypothetical protein
VPEETERAAVLGGGVRGALGGDQHESTGDRLTSMGHVELASVGKTPNLWAPDLYSVVVATLREL